MTHVNEEHDIERGAPYDLENCARCGGDHEGLEPEELERPVSPTGTPLVFTHWCPCPANGQPILWAVADQGGE